MTALAPAPQRSAGRPSLTTTPLWLLTGEATLIYFYVFGLSAWTLDRQSMTLFFGFCLVGATVVFAPRGTFMKVRVPLTAMLFVIWMITTFFWARDSANWSGEARQQFWTFALILPIAGMLPLERIVSSSLKAGYLILLLQAQATVLDPTSRGEVAGIGIDGGFGWQGTFIHKNGLATVLLLFLLTTLIFERRVWLRRTMVPIYTVFIVMSRSSTGLSATIAVFAFAAWLAAYLRRNRRERVAFAISWSLIAIILATAVVLSATVLVSLYGKDLTFSGRTLIWSAALETMTGARWLTGWSLDAFVMGQQYPVRAVRDSVGFGVPHLHNGVMEMLFLYGIPGVVLALSVVAHMLREGWNALAARPLVGRWITLCGLSIVIFNFSEVKIVGAWLALVCMLIIVGIRSRKENWDWQLTPQPEHS